MYILIVCREYFLVLLKLRRKNEEEKKEYDVYKRAE